MRAYRGAGEPQDQIRLSFGNFVRPDHIIQHTEWYRDIHSHLTRNVTRYISDTATAWKRLSCFAFNACTSGSGGSLEPQFYVGDSDIHEGGRFTLGIGQTDSVVAVHKARPADAELYLSALLVMFFPAGEFYVPRFLAFNKEALMQEFVHRSLAILPNERAFLHSYGRFIALCQLIGLADQHVTNLVPSSRGIAVVDGETLFTTRTKQSERQIRTDAGVLSYWDTPLFTCLLPVYTRSPRTGVPRLAETLIATRMIQAPRPCRDPKSIATAIVEGYMEVVSNISDYQERIVRSLDGVGSISVRHIMRTTASYAFIQRIAAAKTGFGSLSEFESSLRAVFSFADPPVANDFEINALKSGEIPTMWLQISEIQAKRYVADAANKLKANAIVNQDVIGRCVASLSVDKDVTVKLLAADGYYDLRAIPC